MGLQFNMSVADLGYTLSTVDIVLYPKYAQGCRVFCDTFMAEAQARCPVRTGFLRSSISASTDGISMNCIAGADYAQYVEYGTSRQSAQPYFEPALQIALETAKEYWDEAEEEAIFQQRQLVQRGRQLNQRINNFSSQGMETITARLSGFLIMILLAILIGIIKGLIEAFKEIFRGDEREQPDSEHSGWSSVSSFISVF